MYNILKHRGKNVDTSLLKVKHNDGIAPQQTTTEVCKTCSGYYASIIVTLGKGKGQPPHRAIIIQWTLNYHAHFLNSCMTRKMAAGNTGEDSVLHTFH